MTTIASSFKGRFPCSSISATPPKGRRVIFVILHEKKEAAAACPISCIKIIPSKRHSSRKCAVAIERAMTTHNKGWIEISRNNVIALFKANHLDGINKIIPFFYRKIILSFCLLFTGCIRNRAHYFSLFDIFI